MDQGINMDCKVDQSKMGKGKDFVIVPMMDANKLTLVILNLCIYVICFIVHVCMCGAGCIVCV